MIPPQAREFTLTVLGQEKKITLTLPRQDLGITLMPCRFPVRLMPAEGQ